MTRTQLILGLLAAAAIGCGLAFLVSGRLGAAGERLRDTAAALREAREHAAPEGPKQRALTPPLRP